MSIKNSIELINLVKMFCLGFGSELRDHSWRRFRNNMQYKGQIRIGTVQEAPYSPGKYVKMYVQGWEGNSSATAYAYPE